MEREAFACAILAARISDGSLAPAPVFAGDIREFPAADLRGSVDMVLGGFPCPPVSNAGSRRGTEDHRWLWPQVLRVLRETEAGWILIENVPGLLTTQAGRAFGGILADLDRLGFDAEWVSLRASDVGAPHRRERIFLLGRRTHMGHADNEGRLEAHGLAQSRGRAQKEGSAESRLPGRSDLANTHRVPWQVQAAGEPNGENRTAAPGTSGEMGHTYSEGLEGRRHGSGGGRSDELSLGEAGSADWPPGPGAGERWASILSTRPELAPATVEPKLRGVADGSPRRVDRLRALGNAVVPAQAERALRILYERMTGVEI